MFYLFLCHNNRILFCVLTLLIFVPIIYSLLLSLIMWPSFGFQFTPTCVLKGLVMNPCHWWCALYLCLQDCFFVELPSLTSHLSALSYKFCVYINIYFLKDHGCSFFLLCISYFVFLKDALSPHSHFSFLAFHLCVLSQHPSFYRIKSNTTGALVAVFIFFVKWRERCWCLQRIRERSSLFWCSYYLCIYTKMDFVIHINLRALSFLS